MVGDRAALAEQAARGAAGRRPAGAQRHFLGAALRGAVARPPRTIRPVHNLLQPLHGIVPHIALRSQTGWGGSKIIPPDGYDASQRIRKRIEEIFG